MKKLFLLLTMIGSSFAIANESLSTLNTQIDTQAEQLEQQHGILMTFDERSSLKVNLIAQSILARLAINSQLTVADAVNDAIEQYLLTDPVEQRQLLIETQAGFAGNGGGVQPPCCK